jgi:hypothetical protein
MCISRSSREWISFPRHPGNSEWRFLWRQHWKHSRNSVCRQDRGQRKDGEKKSLQNQMSQRSLGRSSLYPWTWWVSFSPFFLFCMTRYFTTFSRREYQTCWSPPKNWMVNTYSTCSSVYFSLLLCANCYANLADNLRTYFYCLS